MRYLSSGYLASTSNDNTVKLWNTTTWNLVYNFTGHSYWTYDVIFLSNTNSYASGSVDGTIQIWQIDVGLVRSINVGYEILCLDVLPNGNLIGGDNYGTIKTWNPLTSALVSTYTKVHKGAVFDFEIINNQVIASCSWDYTIVIWNVTTGTNVTILTGHIYYVYALKLISTNLLASLSMDDSIKLWNVLNWSLYKTLAAESTRGFFYSLDLVDCNLLIAGGYGDSIIREWNISANFLYLESNAITTDLNYIYSLVTLSTTIKTFSTCSALALT